MTQIETFLKNVFILSIVGMVYLYYTFIQQLLVERKVCSKNVQVLILIKPCFVFFVQGK